MKVRRTISAGGGNVVWVVFSGLWLPVGHVVRAAATAAAIVGVRVELVKLKLIPVLLLALVEKIVPAASAGRLDRAPAGR